MTRRQMDEVWYYGCAPSRNRTPELKPCPEMIEEVARAIEKALDLSKGLKGQMRADGDFNKAARAAITAYDPDKRLREALEALAVGGEPRPVGKRWRADGQASKNDKCTHDRWMYEDCGECVAEFARAALSHNGG